MARPKKLQETLSEPFMFRLSNSEALALRSKIAAANMNQAEFLRECVLTNKTVVIAKSQVSIEKTRMQFVFNKTGNNLNQIAQILTAANRANKLTDAHYQETLRSLAHICHYLKAALHHVD